MNDPANVRTHINKVRQAAMPHRYWDGLFFSPDGKKLLLAGPSPRILDLQTGAVQTLDLEKGADCRSLVWLNDREVVYEKPLGKDHRVAICRQRIDQSAGKQVAVCKTDSHAASVFCVSPRGDWLHLAVSCKSFDETFVAVEQTEVPSAPSSRPGVGFASAPSFWRPDGSMIAITNGAYRPDKSMSWFVTLQPVPNAKQKQIQKSVANRNARYDWTVEGKYLLIAESGCSRFLVPETGEEISLDAKFDQLLGKPKAGLERVAMASPTPGWLVVIDRPAKMDRCGYDSRLVVDYDVTRWATLSGILTPDGRYEVIGPTESGNVKVRPSPMAKATTTRRTSH